MDYYASNLLNLRKYILDSLIVCSSLDPLVLMQLSQSVDRENLSQGHRFELNYHTGLWVESSRHGIKTRPFQHPLGLGAPAAQWQARVAATHNFGVTGDARK